MAPGVSPGVGIGVQGAGCRVQGAGRRAQGAGCRVQGAGCRVQGAGCRVQGAGSTPRRRYEWSTMTPRTVVVATVSLSTCVGVQG